MESNNKSGNPSKNETPPGSPEVLSALAFAPASVVDEGKQGQVEEEDPPIPPSLLPPKPKRSVRGKGKWAKVNLEDVVKLNPVENEAETYLQKQLEAHTGGEDDDDDDAEEIDVLSAIPDQHLDNFARASERQSVSSRSSSKKNKLKSKGGQKLFDLANELMKEQGGATAVQKNQLLSQTQYDDSDHFGDEDAQKAQEQDIPSTLGDAFVNSAATIFLRKPSAKNKMATAPSDGNMEQPADKKTDHADMQQQAMEEGNATTKGRGKKNIIKKKADRFTDQITSDFHDFLDFTSSQKSLFLSRMRNALFFLMLPTTGIAFFLFYVLDNPPCGTSEECNEKARGLPSRYPNGTKIEYSYQDDPSKQTSVSWFLLFIGVRLVVTCGVAFLVQALLIDFCCLHTSLCARLCGSFITLFMVQSKGWPFISAVWSITNFILLSGSNELSKHWGYWQDWLDIFNDNNPAGEVLSHRVYHGILTAMLVAGAAAAVKRYWLGLWLGRRTYSRYSSELGAVMEKAILVREVAQLSRNKKAFKNHGGKADDSEVQKLIEGAPTAEEESSASNDKEPEFTGAHLSGSARVRINDLLGEFEEPEMFEDKLVEVAISDIIRFRQSVAFLNTPTPFSVAFGKADDRESCIANSQHVYELLVRHKADGSLHFNVLAKVCVGDNDDLDDEKLRKLVKLFRPDRDGFLTKLDFIKSVDTVYKEIRLLRAGVSNSQRVDRSFESIFQVVFYFILGCICLGIIGIDPFALFVAVSGFIVGFAFMIGAACSKIFEGVLLVLVRKPYEIGDKINVSSVTTDTPGGGSSGWLVKDVDLFTTTVTYWNGESATYSNGSLASHRIINMNRSTNAFQTFLVKFPSETDYSKILMFRKCVEMFVKDRPREWLAFNGFRVTRVEIDSGFVEYKVMMTHREKWQNLGAILDSTAEVQTFARELCTKMDIHYQAPAMPVDLHVVGNGGGRSKPGHGTFESIASTDAADLLSQVKAGTDAANLEEASGIKGLDTIQKMFAK